MNYNSDTICFKRRFWVVNCIQDVMRTLVYSCFRCLGRLLLCVLIYGWNLFQDIKWTVEKGPYRVLFWLRQWGLLPVESDVIKSKLFQFRKIPRHVVFILGTESASYPDLVKLISWCLCTGISYISFYDSKNGIDPQGLFEAVCKYDKLIVQKIKWLKSFDENIKLQSKKQINGFFWKPEISVCVYQQEDGLQTLANAARELHQKGLETVDQDELHNYVVDKALAPDPDVAVVCGDVFTTFGYSPWQLHVTQISTLRSHKNITIEEYLNLLHEYSMCEQRYGK